MKTIHKIKIDLLTPGLRSRVYVVQDDICTREVQISLYSGGASWSPAKASAAVGYSKPDGTTGLYDSLPDGSAAISISGNVVTVILAAQMLTCAGTVEAAVTLADANGNQISTFAFDVIVSANPGSGAIKSEDYFNYVNPKIQAVIEQAAAATTAANTAASRANASAELAEDAYDLADTANQKVDTLREVVSKFHNNIVCEETGEVIILSDSAEAPLQGLKVYGKTTQNGTPTPDAPVALESVGDSGSVTTTVCGKNLYHQGGDWVTQNKDGTYTITATASSERAGLVNLLTGGIPKGIYTFSYLQGYGELRIQLTEGVNTYVLNVGQSKTFEYDGESYLRIFSVNVPAGATATYKVQLEQGDKATDWEPYKEPTAVTVTPVDTSDNALYLPGIRVGENHGGNYKDKDGRWWICDEVDFEKGVYVQRVGCCKVTNAKFDITLGSHSRFYSALPKASNNNYPFRHLCTHYSNFDYSYNGDYEHCYAFNKTLYFYLPNEVAQNQSGIDTWIANNDLCFAYILAEPIYHDLTAEEPAQYASMQSHYPNTIVFNDAGAHMEVSYIADTQKYVDKKFEALEAAIASLI